jgi:hypothetical protein
VDHPARLGVRVYALVLRLYPSEFYNLFGTEMVTVFAQAAQDASHRGVLATFQLLLRELIDLPLALALAHLQNWRKKRMQTVQIDAERDVHRVRWMARGLALLLAALILSLFLFNEDVRQEPNPPTVILALTAGCMMLAWRWERVGGTLTWLGAVSLFASELFMWSRPQRFGLPPGGVSWPFLIVIGAATSVPALIVGWLFVSVARASRGMKPPEVHNSRVRH